MKKSAYFTLRVCLNELQLDLAIGRAGFHPHRRLATRAILCTLFVGLSVNLEFDIFAANHGGSTIRSGNFEIGVVTIRLQKANMEGLEKRAHI